LLRALGRETARLGWDLDEVVAEFRQAVSTPPHETMPRSDALAALASQDVAYAALSLPARRLLRLLSLSPECYGRGAIRALLRPSVRRPQRADPRPPREVRGRAADAVFGPPAEWIDQLLGELSGGRFVDGSGGRYQVRELLAPQVRLHLLIDEPVRRRTSAQGRVVRHLARQAARHAARLHAPSARGSGGDSIAWFPLQHDLLHSLVVGGPGAPRATRQPLPRRVRRWRFHLAEALCAWYAVAWRLDEWADVCEAILTTPGSAEDPRSASWAHNQLGVVHRRRSELREARRELVLARSLRRGSRRGTAQVLTNEGLVLLADDEVEPALQRLRLARDHRPAANRPGRALTDMGLGVAQLASGEVDGARRTFAMAADMFGELEDPRGQGAALTNLGLAQWRRGERYDAYQTWELALAAYAEVDDAPGRAAALLNLGASHLLIEPHDAEEALARLAESERLWVGLGASTAGLGRTLVYKGDALALLGREDEARGVWTRAEEVCQAVGDGDGQKVAAERLQRLTPET
jgi:tetratricopeptide (TPR) repeat protein